MARKTRARNLCCAARPAAVHRGCRRRSHQGSRAPSAGRTYGPTGREGHHPGATIGQECVGVVDEVGGEVRNLRPGDCHRAVRPLHLRPLSAGAEPTCSRRTHAEREASTPSPCGRREAGEDREHPRRRPGAVVPEPHRRSLPLAVIGSGRPSRTGTGTRRGHGRWRTQKGAIQCEGA